MKNPTPADQQQLFRLAFKGMSMFPSLKDSDELSVDFFSEPVKIAEIPEGQVVVIRGAGEWVVHRVVTQSSQKTSKGDWSCQFDNAEYAWGQVKKVNGKPSSLIDSQVLSFISKQIFSERSRYIRLIARAFLWAATMAIYLKDCLIATIKT